MAFQKKESFISETESNIFAALKAQNASIFGSYSFADVKDFLVIEGDSNKYIIRFNAEADSNGRQKFVKISAEFPLIFTSLAAQAPGIFTGKTFDDVVDGEFLIEDPDTPGNRRILFKEESN